MPSLIRKTLRILSMNIRLNRAAIRPSTRINSNLPQVLLAPQSYIARVPPCPVWFSFESCAHLFLFSRLPHIVYVPPASVPFSSSSSASPPRHTRGSLTFTGRPYGRQYRRRPVCVTDVSHAVHVHTHHPWHATAVIRKPFSLICTMSCQGLKGHVRK